MDGDDRFLLVAAGFGLLIGVISGLGIGVWIGANDVRKEAVRAGVARYVAGPEGCAKFEWIAPPEKKP